MPEQTTPSNLLIICSDEHRRDAMGCMGHPLVQTPHLDALAARGTLFTNAYTPSPMCVPARAAMAVGDYVHRIGCWDSASPYNGQPPGWMHRLRNNGVNVVSIGKLHFRSTQDDNGFSEERLPMHVVNGVGWTVGLLREKPPAYDSAAELAADVGAGPGSYTDYDRAITDNACEWLLNQRNNPQPWAAFVSLVSPHYPLTCPAEWLNLYDAQKMPLPVGYDDSPSHAELQSLAQFFNYRDYFSEAKVREAIAAYYGLTSFMDDCVGRLLNALEQASLTDNTTIIYISDHGEMLGEHGFWTKQVMYEASAGVPMIIAGPHIPSQRVVGTAATLLDIAPTALDVFNVPADDVSLPGESLLKLASLADNADRAVMSEYHDGGSTTGTFMVRWQHWKYVHYVGLPPQLFNLKTDPHERNDLVVNEPQSANVLHALAKGRQLLMDICDPEQINHAAFSDQRKKILSLGGEQACASAYSFNHTPVPDG